jgi:quercetin dioxygenase-like cupin family protein
VIAFLGITMTGNNMNLATKLAAASCLALAALTPALAQQDKRTPLGTMDFPAGYGAIMGLAEIAPGMCAGRHTHPAIETSYILEGEGVSEVEGRPDRIEKAGDAVQIPANAAHDACASAAGVKILTVHVFEKGKPLGTPVP